MISALREEAVKCPVCGGLECTDCGPPAYFLPHKVAGAPIDLSDLHLTHLQCRNCGYRFVYPPIPEDRLQACYRNGTTNWPTDASVAKDRSYAHKIDLLNRFAPGKRVLDFGCFDGGFLACMPSPPWQRFGIEPSQTAAQKAVERGIEVIAPLLERVEDSAGKFDAIVAFDVFEHLSDPVGTLRNLRGKLTADGIVMIETGNSDAWPKGWGKLYPYCGCVEHVGFFSRKSIEAAAQACEMDVVHFEPSAHTPMSRLARVRNYLYILAYRILRLPNPRALPESIRRKALGPFPRSTVARDHFLAVLRRKEGAARNTVARVVKA